MITKIRQKMSPIKSKIPSVSTPIVATMREDKERAKAEKVHERYISRLEKSYEDSQIELKTERERRENDRKEYDKEKYQHNKERVGLVEERGKLKERIRSLEDKLSDKWFFKGLTALGTFILMMTEMFVPICESWLSTTADPRVKVSLVVAGTLCLAIPIVHYWVTPIK
jgi:hypothetical protein